MSEQRSAATQGRSGVVVVTGAGSGLGFAIASRLVSMATSVVGIDIDEVGLDRTTEVLGERFCGSVCDVSRPEEVEAVFDSIDAKSQPLVGLVNAAGIGGEPGDVAETSIEQWRKTIEINLTGAFIVSRAAVPLLRQSGGGSIVHIASQLGIVGAKGSPAYGASKGGLIALGRAMALDHARDGIRVNSVCPGPVDTPMFQASTGPANLEKLVNEKIPMGRIGTPAEIASLVVFLLGAEAGYLTGSAIPIDGGWTAS